MIPDVAALRPRSLSRYNAGRSRRFARLPGLAVGPAREPAPPPTVRLIDDRGRLFGLVNVLDAALLALALGAGWVGLAAWTGRAGKNAAMLIDEPAWRRLRARVAVAFPVESAFIEVGDTQRGPPGGVERDTIYAKVLAVRESPWEEVTAGAPGARAWLRDPPARVVVVDLLVLARVPIGGDAPQLGSFAVKPGSLFQFRGQRSTFLGHILSVEADR